MMLIDKTVQGFITELASDSSAPGGGSVAALSASLGGALAIMVCRLTVNSEKHAAVHTEMAAVLNQAQAVTASLTRYIDEDTQAFNQVMAAYKLPKATDAEKQARSQKIQESTKQATILPLQVAEEALKVMELAAKTLEYGNPHAASDAAVAGLMAYAGLRGALYNVAINLPGIKDQAFADNVRAKAAAVRQQADKLNQQLESIGKEKLD
ncbi:cyclodeaminase/cyclohydrolase family protein [Acetonema longum]|uniref:Methenyltetrahydrofolate cyclohydrolase n=1 Tax=Acetonema longum DSM 6540 TaxID=1009370 RepID=F7NDM9_9FIRM|nr:cyclodeaminase/cyclohydrolase family protein [Acetonema longum]EGO65891.1 methenyltetrahydrofolate cyclohydrolase [Acetonema longum DSM 6540]